MLSRGIALLAMAWFVLFAQSAQAFFDPPWITPVNPKDGDALFVNIHYGLCDGLLEEPGYPTITQQGNAIRMRWYGQHWPEGSGDLLCSYPIATFTPPIGAYPAGSYTLTLELAYIDFFGAPSLLTIGTVPFTVAAAPAAMSVPAFGGISLAALLGLVLGLGAWALRASRVSAVLLALACLPFAART